VEPKMLEMWPGENGFSLLSSDERLYLAGAVTGCYYQFDPGAPRYVDRRDVPKLPRKRMRDARLDAPSAGTQETPELDGDSEGSGEDG
jgi:hypothetical protein